MKLSKVYLIENDRRPDRMEEVEAELENKCDEVIKITPQQFSEVVKDGEYYCNVYADIHVIAARFKRMEDGGEKEQSVWDALSEKSEE